MKLSVIVRLFLVILIIPAVLFGSQGSRDTATLTVSPATGIATDPARDDSDEDSVYYSYGFEDGWGGWSSIDLSDPGPQWHNSDDGAFDGLSWWCADPELRGYNNHWLQYLLTPELDFSDYETIELKFNVFWAMEDPEDNPPDGEFDMYDGWDGANVWVSTNQGETWQVIIPQRPAYNYESLFSFGHEWHMGPDIPGWCGFSGDWLNALFNLDDYAGEESVLIRWAFCSDPAEATPDDADYLGFKVDNLFVVSGDDIIWSNNGDEQGDMTFDVGPSAGDYWELSEEDAHTGDWSAHCPIEVDLQCALVTAPLEIPDDPWYTYFDFWIHADGRDSDPDEDNSLDDYYIIEVSEDGVIWDKILHDYGRNETWLDQWHYYGPDTTYNDGPDWKRKLNLTGFGGQTIWLRFKVVTDSIMAGNQGTGFWIDDFRLNITNRSEHDVGIDWINIPYPIALDIETLCRMNVMNYGLSDEISIQKFFAINFIRRNAIVPWDGLESDSSDIYTFTLDGDNMPFADTVNVSAWTVLAEDDFHANDTMTIKDVVIYPAGIWNLGYDNRTYMLRYDLEQGSGPLVKFTPGDDGIDDSFDLVAIRTRWDGSQQGDVQTTLHIYDDLRGDIGDQIHTEQITVEQTDLLPYVQVTDLSEVQALKDLDGDFWVWFELTNQEGFPKIIGDPQTFGEGHFYTYDGEDMRESDADWQLHALVMPAGAEGAKLAAGRDEVDFGEVYAHEDHEQRVLLYNAGIEGLFMEDITVTGVGFSVETDRDLPFTLRLGDIEPIYIVFDTDDYGDFSGEISFTCNDENSPVITVSGTVVSVSDEQSVPAEYALGIAYPNPFNSATIIPFSIAKAGDVDLTVFDINGRVIARLVSGRLEAGNHSIAFDATDLSTGVYVYRLNTGNFTVSQKVVMIR